MFTAMSAFDTLQYVEDLLAVGVPEAQAKAHARASARVYEINLDRVATKEDVRLTAAELRGEMAELRTEMRGEIKVVQTQVSQLKWMMGVLGAGVAAVLLRVYFPV